MTDDHKTAIARGRTEGRVVRSYLESLKASRPKRGRKVTAESINARIAAIDAAIGSADAVRHLHLTQERINLAGKLGAAASAVDITVIEAEFVEVAASYSQRTGVTYAAWRQVGVEPSVLKRAGISR